MELDTVHCLDWRELLAGIADSSVDACITDMPYGTTACEWDTPVDLVAWWKELKRVLKPNAPLVTTASQPFTSALVMSNPKWFRHEWIWEKTAATGHFNANRAPMKSHENILVFGATSVEYMPVMTQGKPYRATRGAVGEFIRDKESGGYVTENNGQRYPRSVLKFASVDNPIHGTQKPEALYDYLVRTYTQRGDVVVDPFCGSGTTLRAAQILGRRYIGGDNGKDERTGKTWAQIASERLAQDYTLSMFTD